MTLEETQEDFRARIKASLPLPFQQQIEEEPTQFGHAFDQWTDFNAPARLFHIQGLMNITPQRSIIMACWLLWMGVQNPIFPLLALEDPSLPRSLAIFYVAAVYVLLYKTGNQVWRPDWLLGVASAYGADLLTESRAAHPWIEINTEPQSLPLVPISVIVAQANVPHLLPLLFPRNV